MKLTKEMKNWSKEWLCNLSHPTERAKAISPVLYNWEHGMYFGVIEARRLLEQAETTEAWEVEIMKAIAREKNLLMEEVRDDQKVIINKAWIMGLKAALNYAECVELSGGMWIKERRL